MSIAKLFKMAAFTTAITFTNAAAFAQSTEVQSVAVSPSTENTPVLTGKDAVLDWMMKRISMWSPPGVTYYPDAKETREEALERYRSIANDAITVAFDPEEKPVFSGPYGRMRTAALILAIARSEGGFRKDVDMGVGPQSKGDGGQSWCLMQVRLGSAINGKTKTRLHLTKDAVTFSTDSQDLGGEDLVANRQSCFRAGLHIMRMSFNACRSLPVEERLSSYTSGTCDAGRDASRNRVGTAIRWLQSSPPPMNDSELIKAMETPKTESGEVSLLQIPSASLAN